MGDAHVAAQRRSQYVEFWNNILMPKFVRWRHILVGGLTLHSEHIFPSLPVRLGRATRRLMPAAALGIRRLNWRAWLGRLGRYSR
jgi:hypothetical protein